MRTITITLRGGPLDGETYLEQVLDRWSVLRVEHRRDDRLHVYSGWIGEKSETATLNHIACLTEAEVSE